jgi:hypothetical protein
MKVASGPPYSLSLARRAAPHSRAQPRTGGRDASTRDFVADFAMIGLRAADLSPDARADRVNALESTASGAHAPTHHFVAGLAPCSASEPPDLSPDAWVGHVTALETAGQVAESDASVRLSKSTLTE